MRDLLADLLAQATRKGATAADAFRLGLFALVRRRAWDPLAAALLDASGSPRVRWWPVAYALQRIEDRRAVPALLATAPAVYAAGWATNSSAWVRVRLELADPDEVSELLEEAWRMTATKRAIRAYDEARGR